LRQFVALGGKMDNKKRSEVYERTDEAIQKAFFKLLEKKDFHKITASDIIRVSGVNRSTFYRHYVDKYEILDRIKAATTTMGDNMIAPFIVDNHHQFDIMFNTNYLNESVPEHFKRILLLLLKVRTETFDMEKIVKENFARQFPSKDGSVEDMIKRDLYADVCYRLLINALTEGEIKFNAYAVLGDLIGFITNNE
jgi:AcrR family transcriptional regulator